MEEGAEGLGAREAILDVDGTLAPTTGECKEGMGLAYNGVWGYHPLLVSLANTQEPLYLVNRSGNRPSLTTAPPNGWIEPLRWQANRLNGSAFWGDTDFALTANFDRWTEDGVRFAFGKDAAKNLVDMAEGLDKGRWRALERRERLPSDRKKRKRPVNVKEQIVVEKEYKNLLRSKRNMSRK